MGEVMYIQMIYLKNNYFKKVLSQYKLNWNQLFSFLCFLLI